MSDVWLVVLLVGACTIAFKAAGPVQLGADERLVGVGVAAVAVRLRAPLIAVMVLAAVSTALVRSVV